MKQIIKKHWLLILLFSFLFLIGIPALINWLFKLHPVLDFFSAEWEAGSVLEFYGAILASVAAIIGVYYSIKEAQRNYREDERNRQLPYLALTYLRKQNVINMFDVASDCVNETSINDGTTQYSEYRLEKVYIILTSEGIVCKDKLDHNQQALLEHGGIKAKKEGNKTSFIYQRFISLPFEVENVGNGAAIDLRLSLYRKDDKNPRYVSYYTLKCNETVYFHIFSDLSNINNEDILGDYMLDFCYRDILQNRYSQKYPVSFNKKDKDDIISTVEFSCEQEMISEG
ncbi:MAG: hypothetical protein IJJ85_08715 [Clostridia bacterium]|nr:hypothetical protein [Clostridia bacterium]